jgi:hypothetical protein
MSNHILTVLSQEGSLRKEKKERWAVNSKAAALYSDVWCRELR